MKRTLLVSTISLALSSALGCAPPRPAPAPTTHDHAHSSPHAAQAQAASPARAFELPSTPGSGQPREVRVLVDAPPLKVVAIVLRQGAVLPEHRSPAAVTIQALAGAGTVATDGQRLRIDPTHAVALAPEAPHAVEPDPGTDLVLLVHHAGAAQDHHGRHEH